MASINNMCNSFLLTCCARSWSSNGTEGSSCPGCWFQQTSRPTQNFPWKIGNWGTKRAQRSQHDTESLVGFIQVLIKLDITNYILQISEFDHFHHIYWTSYFMQNSAKCFITHCLMLVSVHFVSMYKQSTQRSEPGRSEPRLQEMHWSGSKWLIWWNM